MIKVGVIRGGMDPHFDRSIENGGAIISHLLSYALAPEYKAVDILVDRDGVWHMNGVPTTPEKVANAVDCTWNALHVPHDKIEFKDQLKSLGIKTPPHLLFEAYLDDLDGPRETYATRKAREVFQKIPPPWRAFPLTQDSSMGIHVCKTLPELVRAFEVGMHERVSVVVEELIEGKQASISVVQNFRGKDVYPFLCLDNLSQDEKREVETLAATIHMSLNLGTHSQTHFVVTPRKGIYVIEILSSPDVHEHSILAEHIASVGSSMPEFIGHVLSSHSDR